MVSGSMVKVNVKICVRVCVGGAPRLFAPVEPVHVCSCILMRCELTCAVSAQLSAGRQML